jgi:hypothetical protein
MTGDRSDREAIGEALRYIEEARNPYMAWRYAPRSGQNDTHCTVRMLMTLRTGMMCGYPIADDAVRVPLEWIDKVTLPEWGEIGYDATTTCFRSGVQAKKFALTMAMTAAGTYGRFLCGEGLASNKPAKKGIELCLDASPAWEEDAFVDMYYWYWGSLLAQQAGTSSPWNAALRKALLPHQDEDGSWPADGAWGWTAGRVYATGISVLALLAPYRFERDFFRERELHPLYARAVKVLRNLEQDQRDELHRAAAAALATAGLP